MTHRDIAVELGINEATAKVRLHRARKSLAAEAVQASRILSIQTSGQVKNEKGRAMFRGSHARVQDALALLVDGSVQAKTRRTSITPAELARRVEISCISKQSARRQGSCKPVSCSHPLACSEVMRSLDENGVRSQRTKPFGVAAALGGTVLAACGLVIWKEPQCNVRHDNALATFLTLHWMHGQRNEQADARPAHHCQCYGWRALAPK